MRKLGFFYAHKMFSFNGMYFEIMSKRYSRMKYQYSIEILIPIRHL